MPRPKLPPVASFPSPTHSLLAKRAVFPNNRNENSSHLDYRKGLVQMSHGAGNSGEGKIVSMQSHAGVVLSDSVPRITSRDLLGAIREIEIEHEGRIYRLRLTQSNKLILTA